MFMTFWKTVFLVELHFFHDFLKINSLFLNWVPIYRSFSINALCACQHRYRYYKNICFEQLFLSENFMHFVKEMDNKQENTARETEGKMMGGISSAVQTLPVAPESPRSPVAPSLTSHSVLPHLQPGLLWVAGQVKVTCAVVNLKYSQPHESNKLYNGRVSLDFPSLGEALAPFWKSVFRNVLEIYLFWNLQLSIKHICK